MEATYIGIHMWEQAVEKAKTTDVDKVIAGDGRPDLQGALAASRSKMDAKNHHLHKPVFIGEVKADGQFNVVWKTPGPDPRAAVEPVHPRQRQEEGRAGADGEDVAGSGSARRARRCRHSAAAGAAGPRCLRSVRSSLLLLLRRAGSRARCSLLRARRGCALDAPSSRARRRDDDARSQAIDALVAAARSAAPPRSRRRCATASCRRRRRAAC